MITEPAEIGRYLRSLRDHDRAATAAGGADAEAMLGVLEAHTVVMAHDRRDEPVEESLATWLSLLDDESWRERVRAVLVDVALLRGAERELLERVRAACAPVAV